MSPRTHQNHIVCGALALVALLGGASASAQHRMALGQHGTQIQSDPDWFHSQPRPMSFIEDGYECTCVEHYKNGVNAYVTSCDASDIECPDVSLLLDCREDQSAPGCDDYLLSCECDCTALELTIEFQPDPDVLITGMPELYQFESRCDAITGVVPVGCGPVAGAMLLYHWAQQGYENLVEDFLTSGSDPASEVQDWQALVQELRDDYLDGGICVPFTGYATKTGKMESGLEAFIEDSGYDADIDHFKVCDDCAANANDELTKGEALSLIRDELEAGRPLILGFNSGRAMRTETQVTDDGVLEWFYTGALSNGTPIAGTIDHYAVITGYRRIAGRDVITVNSGWGWPDVSFEWNPGGRWAHLYTVDIDGAVNGDDWCSIDRGVTAFSPTDIYMSHVAYAFDSEYNDLELLAGDSCGVARPGETVRYYDETHTEDYCANVGDLPTGGDLPRFDDDPSGPHGEPGGGYVGGGNPPILDELLPVP